MHKTLVQKIFMNLFSINVRMVCLLLLGLSGKLIADENVPFVFSNSNNNDADFLSFCDKRGLKTLKGHRSVGGFRASIYNAMPESGVDALINTIKEYSKKI